MIALSIFNFCTQKIISRLKFRGCFLKARNCHRSAIRVLVRNERFVTSAINSSRRVICTIVSSFSSSSSSSSSSSRFFENILFPLLIFLIVVYLFFFLSLSLLRSTAVLCSQCRNFSLVIRNRDHRKTIIIESKPIASLPPFVYIDIMSIHTRTYIHTHTETRLHAKFEKFPHSLRSTVTLSQKLLLFSYSFFFFLAIVRMRLASTDRWLLGSTIVASTTKIRNKTAFERNYYISNGPRCNMSQHCFSFSVEKNRRRA